MEDANYYVDFCEDNNSMISAGLDWHGEFNARTIGIPKVNLDKVKLDFIKIIWNLLKKQQAKKEAMASFSNARVPVPTALL